MGAILSWLVGLVSSLITWAVTKFGIKLAISATEISVWLLLVGSFYVAIHTCFASSSCQPNYSNLSQYVRFGLGLIPSNVPTVIACIVSAYAASWSARFLSRILRMKARVANGD